MIDLIDALILTTNSFSDSQIYKEITYKSYFVLGSLFIAFAIYVVYVVTNNFFPPFFWSASGVMVVCFLVAGFIWSEQKKPLTVSQFEEIIEYATSCERERITQLIDDGFKISLSGITPILSHCRTKEENRLYKPILGSVGETTN